MLHKLENQAQVSRPMSGTNPWVGGVGLFLAVGVGYFLAAQLGLSLLTTAERVAVFWPASGISVGILIALGRRARWPVALGVIAATLAANLTSDRSVWSALAFGLCNAGEALLATWLIERWFGPAFNLDTVRRVVGFFAAIAVAMATSALGAAAAMKLFGPSTAEFLDVWQIWFVSDALGAVTIAPLFVGIVASLRDPPSWRELLEGTLAVVAVAVTYAVALAVLAGPRSLMTPGIFVFPLLLWLSSRCRPVFAAAAAFSIASAIVWTTIHEFGRFGDPSRAIADRALAAQVAVMGTALAALALAALFAERRRSEAALSQSDIRLRSILDAANVIAWDVDLTRDTVHSVGPVARLLHRSEGPMPSALAAMVETIHPEDRDRVMAQFWTAVSTAATYRLEFRLNSDPVCWVAAEGAVERDADGRPVRVRGITHDITDRKRAELALAERDAQLGLAGKAARVGSFAMDYATERIQASPGYAAIHGFAEGTEDFTLKEWRARLHPDDLARLAALRSRIFTERCSEFNIEYRIVGADRKARWIESRGLVSYDGDGRPMRLVGVHIDITERKRAQAALEESEARYRALYHDNPSMYFTVDAAGIVLSVNEFGARQLGYTPAELAGQSVLKVIHEEDREAARQHLASCVKNPEAVSATELRKVHRDGSVVWVREAARAVSAGQTTMLLLVCEEITDRKHAEDGLKRAERKLRDLLGALPAAIYVTDAVGHVTYCNQSAIDLWGREPRLGEDKWSDLAEYYHADGAPMALADCPTEIALRQGCIVRGQEAILERRDGTRVPVAPYPTPLRDETGAIVGAVNMTVDISERRKAELALAERNIQLALAGKAALVGSFAYDTGTEVMQISEGYAAIHGLPEGTTEERRSECLASVHRDDIGRVEQSRSEAFRARRREYNVEYRIVLAGGEVRWVETRCFISYDGEGRPHRVIGVSIDITERKRVEEQQGKLVAELDHRVKNVLATVQAVAAHTMGASSSMEHFVAALDGRIRSMGSTHELLSNRRWLGIPLAELVQRELAPYTTGSNTEIDGPEVMLSAEASQTMGMVLHELVTNAAKYGALSAPSGRVSIRWHLPLNGDASDRLVIVWRESGGPTVVPPSKSSYGMHVVRELVPYELGGAIEHVLAPEGAQCQMTIPLARLGRGTSRHDGHQAAHSFHAPTTSAGRGQVEASPTRSG
jgi:PAS domain S-box-containing protein